MTIKIVKRGTPPAEVVYQTTCSGVEGCGSVLEYNKGDVASVGDSRDPCYILVCPVCNTHIHMSAIRKKNEPDYPSNWLDR